MKTLTYLNAFEEALRGYHSSWRKMLELVDSPEYSIHEKIFNKRHRQIWVFKEALTKRLQDQEGELERLKAGMTLKEVLEKNFPNTDLEDLCTCKRCRDAKPKWQPIEESK